MLLKNSTLFVTAILCAAVMLMVFEWKFAYVLGKGETAHYYIGLSDTGVGEPYCGFIHHLRSLSEVGDLNRVRYVLRAADEHSHDIYDVWLSKNYSAYKASLDEILRSENAIPAEKTNKP